MSARLYAAEHFDRMTVDQHRQALADLARTVNETTPRCANSRGRDSQETAREYHNHA